MGMANKSARLAPGAPGIEARWTSSAKVGVGTALSNNSHVWFTLSHGIFNEIYYPRIDQACVRDMGLIVTDGRTFFSEEKRDADSSVHWLVEGVPAFGLVNVSRDGRYRIEKQTLTDPHHDTVLQQVRFIAQQGSLSDYRLHVLLAPHLGNQGGGNTAWVDDFQGTPLLFARREGNALALGCSAAWAKRSVGYVGSTDGWQDLKAHNRMTWEYERAENGNVAMVGEIDLLKSQGDFVLALGFGIQPESAARNAISSLRRGFAAARKDYIAGWQGWIRTHTPPKTQAANSGDLTDISLAVLRTHESKAVPGGLIASLSIPWGFSKGDNDLGGYHLVWPRDMAETAGGLLAAGAHEDARRVLLFLQATQEADGHWPQNMWLDGSPYWNGIQMDETALPILLMDLIRREEALTRGDMIAFWPMVRQAAGYLVRNGPVSPQDRWEEDPGYSPFTVAAEIAALLVAADLAEAAANPIAATYLRETADAWNASIERWLYVAGTALAQQHGVDGYYVRVAEPDTADAASPRDGFVPIKNRPPDQSTGPAALMVSLDALAFVRFGLRAADDPRIVSTVKVIDATLKVDTPLGPAWHRYEGDGYGEHADGRPFDGTGVGRAWPLLTGERAHYELAAGRRDVADGLAQALERFAGESGLLPEQIWDTADNPERDLVFGMASGSARPLVWAHAEYLKLCRSLRDGEVFDRPLQTVQRYLVDKVTSSRVIWRFNNKIRAIPIGATLRVETLAAAVVHWSVDGWRTVHDSPTRDTTLGVHLVDLPTAGLPMGAWVDLTFYWPQVAKWEGVDFRVGVE